MIASLQEVVRQTDGDHQGVLHGERTMSGTEVRSCRPVASFSPEAMGRAATERDVVGYYRIRHADTMRLTDLEAAIADTSFAKPGSVVLLIKRREGGGQANFFFRENGALVNLSLLMFPLDAAQLERKEAALLPAPVEPSPEGRRRSWVGLAAAGAILASGLGASAWYLRNRAPAAEARAAPTSTAPLPLRAERQGEDLKVMWDLGAASIANAVSGVLDIDDGGTKRRIPLDERQVRFGSVLYTPQSDEVSIDFTAVKEDGTAGQASVLVLLTRTAGGAAVRNVAGVTPNRGADRRSPAPVHPFVPPPSKEQPVASNEGESLPSVQLHSQVAAIRLPLVAAPAPLPPAQPAPQPVVAAPPQQRVEAPAPAPPKQSVAEPVFYAPQIVSQVGARVPPELRGFLTRPITVSIRATIDETGRVIHAEAVPQKVIHVGFFSAASEAAMRCRFIPARRGNTPVRGEAVLTFHFQPR